MLATPETAKTKMATRKSTGFCLAGCPLVGRYLDSEVIITSINNPNSTEKTTADRKGEVQHSLEDRVPVGVAVSKDARKPDADGVRTFPCPIPDNTDEHTADRKRVLVRRTARASDLVWALSVPGTPKYESQPRLHSFHANLAE